MFLTKSYSKLVAPTSKQSLFTRGYAEPGQHKLIFTFGAPHQTFYNKKEIAQVRVPGKTKFPTNI